MESLAGLLRFIALGIVCYGIWEAQDMMSLLKATCMLGFLLVLFPERGK